MSVSRNHTKGADSVHTKRWLWVLLPILLVFASITSFIAGMNINKTTESSMGQIVDTIILSPKQEVQMIALTGQLLYPDGTPCVDQLVELRSDPMQTVTDADGRFTFSQVPVGTHTLSLLNQDGTVMTSQTIYIEKIPQTDVGTVSQSGDSYHFQVHPDMIAISIRMELGEENRIIIHEEVLSLKADGTVLKSDGTVVGTAIDFYAGLIEEGAASGALTPEESLPEESAQVPPVRQPGVAPQAAESEPETSVETEATEPETVESPPETTVSRPTDSDGDSSGSSKPTRPEETAAPLDVRVSDEKNEQWTQNTTIDLFADRTGAGIERKLMPGSTGTYRFQVVNYNTYPVSYTMNMLPGEGQLLLPLRYRLKSGGVYLCGDENTGLTAEQLYQEAISLKPESSNEYLLEWEWLFHGGDDELDTKIASAMKLEYQIIVSIQITQV